MKTHDWTRGYLSELRTEIRHEDYTQALRVDELGMVFLRVDKVIQTAIKKLPIFEVSSPSPYKI